jgi:hypothetical protein
MKMKSGYRASPFTQNNNVFKRIADSPQSIMPSELVEDKPVTEMEAVEARFGDLIF